jgi:hypothetical protein
MRICSAVDVSGDLAKLDQIQVKGHAPKIGYDRDRFGAARNDTSLQVDEQAMPQASVSSPA